MARLVQLNDVARDQFAVFDFDGYTKVSGQAAFTTRLWKDGVLQSSPTVTITEIGTSGEYKTEFTPTAEGWWKLEVLIDYNKDTFFTEFESVSGTVDDVYDEIIDLDLEDPKIIPGETA